MTSLFKFFFPLQIPNTKLANRILSHKHPLIIELPFPIRLKFNLVQCNEIKCKNVIQSRIHTHKHSLYVFQFCYSEQEISSILGILQIWIIFFSRLYLPFCSNERARFFLISMQHNCFCFRLSGFFLILYSIRKNCSK